MKKLIVKVLPLVLISALGYSQGFEFKVLASKGENKVQSGGEWSPIKTGAALLGGSKIEVGASSYLGLMHKTGKTMEIKTPGTYMIDDLSKKVLTGGSSVASKYGEYLMAHMSESGSDDVNLEKLNNMNVTGAVSRATDDETMDILIPEGSQLLTTADAFFRWMPNPNKEDDSYEVTVVNLLEEEVARVSVSDPWFDLESIEGVDIESQMGLIVSVKSATDESYFSSKYALSAYMDPNREELIKQLTEYKSDLPVEEDAMRNFLLAMFYEQNKMNFHALSCYTKLLVSEPENEFYAASYLDFVKRAGLEQE